MCFIEGKRNTYVCCCLTGSSSNGSNTSATVTNNNNKNSWPHTTPTASQTAGISGSAQMPTAPNSAILAENGHSNPARRVAPGVGWDQASGSVSASAPPSCGSGGSVDDEWSRQMDELDRLRPSTADPTTSCGSGGLGPGRSVIDFFTDLPDIVVDDESALPPEPPINMVSKSGTSFLVDAGVAYGAGGRAVHL